MAAQRLRRATIRKIRPNQTAPALRSAGASHAPVFMDK
jgi:hypothetical protein